MLSAKNSCKIYILNFRKALVAILKGQNPVNQSLIREFDMYLLIIHYYTVKGFCSIKNMKEMEMKLSISLIKFCDIIPYILFR